MEHVEKLLAKLAGVVPAGRDNWKAVCPAHTDQDPSLSVRVKGDGKVLLNCLAGCRTEKVLKALGLGWGALFGDGPATGAVWNAAPRAGASADDLDFRDTVYRNLIAELDLEFQEEKALLARGLPAEGLRRAGYRTIAAPAYHRALARVWDAFGARIYRVPGILRTAGGAPALSVRSGLLIPVRDVAGSVVACQVRTGEAAGKYKWLSGETSCGTPAHVPLECGSGEPCLAVRVTEGPLKADVACALDRRFPTVGVGGVTAWKAALPVLAALRTKQVRLAFDSDWHDKPAVRDQLFAFAAELLYAGYDVLCETWDAHDGKGIDDLLAAGGSPGVVKILTEEG